MVTAGSLAAADPHLRRVGEHIEELRRAGRGEDADAVGFVRDLAEVVLRELRPNRRRDLLTTGDAAIALGLSNQTVRNWVAAGRLSAVKRGVRTMISRQAVEQEIERSRIEPRQTASAPDLDDARLAWRRELLAAIPRDIAGSLSALHDKVEDGAVLTTSETAEMTRLEQAIADAAARHLRREIRRGRAGSA
ncbi:MAG: DNA-binding protein [Chloroflexota bacterium]|nr:MAG: DNA-binding protein [Chloroflexota bacterium]